MKLSQRIAFCGVICALSIMVLLMTLFPFATYALAALAGLFFIPVVLELDVRYGLACYAVTAALAFFITPDMEAKVLFILFFGYYPAVQLRLNLMRNTVASWALKFLIFNVAVVGGYVLMLTTIGLPPDSFTIGGVHLPYVFLAAGNVVFAVYDVAITRVTAMYRIRLHPMVKKLFK